jgi:hypothetical protein
MSKKTYYGFFLFSYLIKNKRKKFNTPQTSLLTLDACKTNSLAISESSCIKLSNENKT